MKLLKKNFYLVLLSFVFVASFGFVSVVSAEDTNPQTTAFMTASGLPDTPTAGSVVATVIEAFLGFLGIIFVIQMIYAGFSWMTAAGNDDQVKKATALIRRSIIGLIIIVSAYAITYTVFNLLPGAGGSGSGTANVSVDVSKQNNK